MELINALKEVGNALIEKAGVPGLIVIGSVCAVMLVGAFVWHRSEQSQWEELVCHGYQELMEDEDDYE